jgi:hypothetical protein
MLPEFIMLDKVREGARLNLGWRSSIFEKIIIASLTSIDILCILTAANIITLHSDTYIHGTVFDFQPLGEALRHSCCASSQDVFLNTIFRK